MKPASDVKIPTNTPSSEQQNDKESNVDRKCLLSLWSLGPYTLVNQQVFLQRVITLVLSMSSN